MSSEMNGTGRGSDYGRANPGLGEEETLTDDGGGKKEKVEK